MASKDRTRAFARLKYALRGLPFRDSSTHSPGGGKTVSVPSTLVPEPHERCRPNDYQIPTRGKASCCPDGRRSVRRERCADVPRQADRPVGTLRCRSTRDAVSVSTRSCPGVGLV